MEGKIVVLDTSILIDYFRKKDKSKTFLFSLTNSFEFFGVSAITEFEIFVGSNELQNDFWENFFKEIIVYPFDSECSRISSLLDRTSKKNSKQMEIPDLFIAATAIRNNLQLAT